MSWLFAKTSCLTDIEGGPGRLLTDGTLLVPYTVALLARRDKLVQQETRGNGEALYQGALSGLELIGVNNLLKPGRSSMDKDQSLFEKERQQTIIDEDDRVWLHCSVGEAMEEDEIEGERTQVSLYLAMLRVI